MRSHRPSSLSACHLLPFFAPPLQLHLPPLSPPQVFVISICHLFITPRIHLRPSPPYHLRDPIPSGNVSAPGALISNSSAAVIGVVDNLKLTSQSTFGHILSESGASRLFACTSAGASASATDFTVNCSGSPQVLRAGRSAHPALFPAPASIIIAVADKSNALPALAPLTPAAAAFFYLAGRFAVVADAAQACVSSPLFVCIFSNICPLPPPSLCSTLTI